MLFVSRFLLLTRRALALLLFGLRGLCLRLLFRRFHFLLRARRFHARRSRWRRNLLSLWLPLIGLARIPSCWLLSITEHGQTHEQCTNRSKPDSHHTVLLMSSQARARSSPKNQMRILVIADKTNCHFEGNLGRTTCRGKALLHAERTVPKF